MGSKTVSLELGIVLFPCFAVTMAWGSFITPIITSVIPTIIPIITLMIPLQLKQQQDTVCTCLFTVMARLNHKFAQIQAVSKIASDWS